MEMAEVVGGVTRWMGLPSVDRDGVLPKERLLVTELHVLGWLLPRDTLSCLCPEAGVGWAKVRDLYSGDQMT